MKTLNILALITSILCIATSLIQKDYTETMAWFIVTLYNFKHVFEEK